uniref:Uncharacterized protein n=1 Tax=Spongospora subterranea TaxID=70186 RepID=A0A0H5QPP9_9EUKA|eukprot:CRZ03356.1 hypothetical protein [Spongospora subterranea]
MDMNYVEWGTPNPSSLYSSLPALPETRTLTGSVPTVVTAGVRNIPSSPQVLIRRRVIMVITFGPCVSAVNSYRHSQLPTVGPVRNHTFSRGLPAQPDLVLTVVVIYIQTCWLLAWSYSKERQRSVYAGYMNLSIYGHRPIQDLLAIVQ